MISLLARIFIKPEGKSAAQVRTAYGTLSGVVGILLNIFLFAGKFLAGTLSHSIAITADAFNNLSDAGSSVVTLLGFQLAGQRPDPHQPSIITLVKREMRVAARTARVATESLRESAAVASMAGAFSLDPRRRL